MSAGDSGGQLTDDRPRLIPVARVVKPIGLLGDLGLHVLTDVFGVFEPGTDLFIGEDRAPAVVERFSEHAGGRLKLAGIDTRDRAEFLRGQTIYCDVERAVGLLDGRYFEFQIVGLRVVTTDNEILGSVVEIIKTGANDVYVVRNDSTEIMLPATKEVVVDIDLEKEMMTVQLIPGLRGDP